ncbi:hypothetical protein [Klebsiella michiganensis]|uniref:hypothetical protein n=1 Tax=Klebsiella michiganensis TaxID=1134687 RepID=UPI0012B6C4E9|nr:hypothetical protein [Klebsiella michiganensis]MDV0361163.1 hypothetical protein [Klebsiella michiganensis]
MNLKNRTKQLTEKELEDLICELEAAGFYRRQLIGLTELQERRKAEANNKPVAWTCAEQLRDAKAQGCGYIFGLGIPAKAGHQIMLYANMPPVTSELFISGVRDEDGDCTTVDDADAQFWTVYRRNEDGTCDALMDFMSRESAEKAIQMIVPEPKQKGVDSVNIKAFSPAKGPKIPPMKNQLNVAFDLAISEFMPIEMTSQIALTQYGIKPANYKQWVKGWNACRSNIRAGGKA